MTQRLGGNAEAQVFNLAPVFGFLQRQQQIKLLQDRTLDKQISDDLAKYKPDGMRPQDVDQFLNKYQNLKNMSINYREAIKNPAQNPKAWQAFQDERARLMGLVAESKAAKENEKSLTTFYANHRDKIDDDAFKQTWSLYKSPLGTPEHESVKDFDLTKLTFNPANFNQQKWR